MGWRDPHGGEMTDIDLSAAIYAALAVGTLVLVGLLAGQGLPSGLTILCCGAAFVLWAVLAIAITKAAARRRLGGPPTLMTAPPYSALPPPEEPPADESRPPPSSPDTCASCGATLRPNARFCGACGAAVDRP